MYGTDEVSNSSTTNPFQQDMNADEQIDNKKKKKKAPKAASQSPKTQERTRSSTVVADTSNAMDHETDRSCGLSTIGETHDQPTDDEVDFGGYFDRIQKTKRLAPTIPANSQSDDVQTPTISTYTTKPNEGGDSTDDDVDELLGKLEVSLIDRRDKYIHARILHNLNRSLISFFCHVLLCLLLLLA